MTKKKAKNSVWRVTQPPIDEEVVIFSNAAKPTYHYVKWAKQVGETYYNNDWDIKLSHGFFVGPRNFEGGTQFSPDVKEKEFFWMPRKEFVKKVKRTI
jgi:hypothetical protein